MPVVYFRPIGDGLAYIHPVEGPVDPGFGWGGGDHISNRPPWSPAHPGNRPPGSGHPAFPDNTLPGGPPPQVSVGETLVMVRDPGGVWHYATLPAGTPPPTTLPEPPPTAQPKPA